MITDIHIQGFRSYIDDSFDFDPGVNIIVGPNATGKTNLLEAILVTCRGSSYRAKDLDLINHNQVWAKLEAHDSKSNSRIVTIENEEGSSNKEFKINGKKYKRISMAKAFPVVVFEPNHLRLLQGSPDMRRQFIDDLLIQTKPGYNTIVRQYQRTLRQRNALLKNRATQKDQLFVWSVRLSELGEQIVRARDAMAKEMNNSVQTIYSELAPEADVSVSINYRALSEPEMYGTTLLRTLEERIKEDFDRGFTSHGPHREDLEIMINGRLSAETASRGESRTLVLSLKIIEAKLLEQYRDNRPILLLDDVFSELDGKRRQALTLFLKDYQTFITTTDADVVIQHFTEKSKIIPTNP